MILYIEKFHLLETLLDKRWKPQDYNNLKLVLDKLKFPKDIYEKTKGD